MIAIDTNVVVRVLTDDDPAQAGAALKLIEREAVFVSATVVLETAWVLKSQYGFAIETIVEALREFLAMPNVTVESADRTETALRLTLTGMDIADAIHICLPDPCTAFVTFDKALVKSAKSAPVRVRLV